MTTSWIKLTGKSGHSAIINTTQIQVVDSLVSGDGSKVHLLDGAQSISYMIVRESVDTIYAMLCGELPRQEPQQDSTQSNIHITKLTWRGNTLYIGQHQIGEIFEAEDDTHERWYCFGESDYAAGLVLAKAAVESVAKTYLGPCEITVES